MTKQSKSGLVDLEGKPITSKEKKTEGANDFPEDLKLPEADFIQHIVSMITAAKTYLGIQVLPDKAPMKPHKEMAKYHIDMIEVIQNKCKGNLSEQENQLLEQALYELRRLFINVFSSDKANNGGKEND